MSKNTDLYLSDERYLVSLKRQRERIAAGIPRVAVDSDVTGDKWTHCSWGLCSMDKEAWPDAEDHLFPEQFVKFDRIAPKYRRENQVCPIDKRQDGGPNGCFYTCGIFQARRGKKPKRESILAKYDARIASTAARLAAPADGGAK